MVKKVFDKFFFMKLPEKYILSNEMRGEDKNGMFIINYGGMFST